MNKLTKHFFESGISIFTKYDVTVAIEGTNHSRNGLIRRALAEGDIIDIKPGLYCLAPKYQKKPVSAYSIAMKIYGPCCVSMETALSHYGWSPEVSFACVCASFKESKEFKTPLGLFIYRRVPQRIFFTGVDRCKDEYGNIYLMATPEKALADYVYFYQLDWVSIAEVIDNMRLYEECLKSVSVEKLEELKGNYSSSRVKKFITGWITDIT